jgi:ketosteroid isomerase-like protein
MRRTLRASLALLGLALVAACGPSGGEPPPGPAEAVEALLAADRHWAGVADSAGFVQALAGMLASDVRMPVAPGGWAEGATAAVAAVRANPANLGAFASWTPIRGGVSADGLHGFTYGYLTLVRADSSTSEQKYLSYWVRGTEGWRVAAYKRAGRPEGAVARELLPPALPPAMVPPTADARVLEAHRASLDSVERAFAAEAQVSGLGPAFAAYGSDDAMNLGRGPAFTMGAAGIAAEVQGDRPPGPSPVDWAPHEVLVASSGDLGVTFGTIVPNEAPADGAETVVFPFFTVWRRADPSAPWRYVAE